MTGDVMYLNLNGYGYIQKMTHVKQLFSKRINCLGLLQSGYIIVRAKDGLITKVSFQTIQIVASCELLGGVKSRSFTNDQTHFFTGSIQSSIYLLDTEKLIPELRNTCHQERINDVAFLHSYSDVFATSSLNDIRVWNAKNRQNRLEYKFQIYNVGQMSI